MKWLQGVWAEADEGPLATALSKTAVLRARRGLRWLTTPSRRMWGARSRALSGARLSQAPCTADGLRAAALLPNPWSLLEYPQQHPAPAQPPQNVSKQAPMHRFTTSAGLASLERVLKAYAAADPEVNYCQARLLGS